MRGFLLAGIAAAALFGASAIAQGPGRGGPLARADVATRVQASFDRVDANHDGFITHDEITAFRDQMRQRFAGGGGEAGGPAAGGSPPGGGRGFGGGIGLPMGAGMFEQADSNHDGKLSAAEAQATALARFDAADTNHEGTLSDEERQAMRAAAAAPQN